MASTARWAALLSFAFLQAIGLSITWLLQRTPRAPLPHDEVVALTQVAGAGAEILWPKPRVKISTLPGASETEAGMMRGFAQELSQALADDTSEVSVSSKPSSTSAGLDICAQDGGDVQACLDSLGDQPVAAQNVQLGNTFELLVAPNLEGKSALFIGTHHNAVLRWSRSQRAADLAAQVSAHLRDTWLQRVAFDNETLLFEVAPAYVFSFSLVGDCNRRIAWDFPRAILGSFLERFLGNLRLLFDLELESQVVQCGSLGGSGKVVSAATLQEDFLRRASEWPGDSVTRDARWLPPQVRFVAFKPSTSVRVIDTERRPQRSFAMQGWGTVSLVGAANVGDDGAPTCKAVCGGDDGAPDILSRCEAGQAVSAWVSTLRSWLKLPPDSAAPVDADDTDDGGLVLHVAAPTYEGITSWEVLRVARGVHRLFLRRTAETLENVVALIDSLPDVVVRPEIGDMLHEAAAEAQRSLGAAAAEDFTTALAASRRALALALTASLDDTVVAEMYFSAEFKYAVYLPLALPILLPTIVGLFRQVKKSKEVGKKQKQL